MRVASEEEEYLAFVVNHHYTGNFNNLTKYYDFTFVNFLIILCSKSCILILEYILLSRISFFQKKSLLSFTDLHSFLIIERLEIHIH